MKNLIIDGGNMLHRTYYTAQRKPKYNKAGINVGHIYWFLSKIKELQIEFECDNIFVAWDIRDKSFTNFRQEAVDYKGSRDRTKDIDIHKFDSDIWQMCEYLGMRCFRANKLEADDIIAWMCDEYLRSDDQNIIVSSDKDFIQLLNLYENVNMYSMTKYEMITAANATDFTDGVSLHHHLLYKAVMGDSSDNIKGLFRYGPKKSATFVKEFKENFQNLKKDDQKTVYRNIRIMDLREGLRVYPDERTFYSEQIKDAEVDLEKFFKMCEQLGVEPILRMKQMWRSTFGKNNTEDLLSLLL